MKISTGVDRNPQHQAGKEQEARVDISDEASRKRWSEVLHLTEEELVEAVKAYGPVVRNIRIGLRSRAA